MREASAGRGTAPRNCLERGRQACARVAASGAAALRAASHLASRSMAARTTTATSLRAALASVRALPDAAPLDCRRSPRASSISLLGSLLSRRSLHQWPNPDFPALPPLLLSTTTSPAACQLASREAGPLLTHHGLGALQDGERGSSSCMPPHQHLTANATHARTRPRITLPRCERHRISPADLQRRDPPQPLPRGLRPRGSG